MRTEKQALVVSLAGVLAVSALGIGFGWASGSYAITFDGAFSLVDAGMSVLAIALSGLIARTSAEGLSERFRMGHWHLEPLLLAVNALAMMAIASYALVQAVGALGSGGRAVEFGPALGYAVVVVALSAGFGVAEHRANRRIGSGLVAMDVKGWLMTGGVTGALLIAFGVALVLERTGAAHLTPYVDPAVLVVVAGALLPVPYRTLRRAVDQIVLTTPPDLQAEASAVAAETVAAEAFLDAEVYTARVGRSHQVEIVFLVPPDHPARPLTAWDDVRRRVVGRLGGDDPNHWITVSFTTDPAFT